jgi:protoheme IX farnesyltransferase
LGAALALGAIFAYYAARLWRDASTAAAARLFRYSILYLWLLCLALVVDKRIFA